MAELTYRQAISHGIAQEMARDERVCLVGEDVAAAGGVFKLTDGLLDRFGPERVRDTPISEQAIVGLAMGAAMTGLRPIAEIMYSDFLAVCWDQIANQVAKARYMSNGQVSVPLVIRTLCGSGFRFGAQHSQCNESWAMSVPGLKVVVPSTPRDVVGLLAASVRDPDPVLFFEHKTLLNQKEWVPDGEYVDELGTARVLRTGGDLTIVSIGSMVPRAVDAATALQDHGLDATVIDLRSLVPLDTVTILAAVERTGFLATVEENPRLCGWGAEVASIVAEDGINWLDGPIVRVTTPHVPMPAAGTLEDAMAPSVDRIVDSILRARR